MTTFYLVRHAHAVWTPDEQRPLSARGHADAQRVARTLCAQPIQRLYSSPFLRARQTILPLVRCLGISIHIVPALRERKLSAGQVPDFFSAVKQVWRDPTFAHPGGESNVQAQQRGVALVHRLSVQHPTQHIVLATHGNLMTLILQCFSPHIDYDFWRALTMPDIYKLDVGEGEANITRVPMRG